MSSSCSPRRRAALMQAKTEKSSNKTTTTPILSNAHAYLQRFQSSAERRQPHSSSFDDQPLDSSSSSSSGNNNNNNTIQHIPPIDAATTLSYSETSVDRYDPQLPQVLSNDISEMTGGTGLSSPNHHHTMTSSIPQPTSWWLNMFQQLEHRHEEERKTWQEYLAQAETKKSQYKSELRHNISNQLQWLEERMTSPTHMLPNSSCSSSTSSNFGHDRYTKWKQKATVLKELMELTEKQHGVEKLEWEQKYQNLEATLEATRDNYTKQLEGSFKHQEYMEGLVQQWKETADGAVEEQRELQAKLENTTHTIAQVQREKETTMQRNQELQETLDSERKRNATLQQELQKTRSDTSKDNEMRRLQETLAMERKRIEEAERQNRALQTELQSKLRALQTELQSKTQEVTCLEDRCNQAESAQKVLQAQLDDVKQQQYEQQQQNVRHDHQHEEHLAMELNRLNEQLKLAQEEALTFRAQAADFSEAATTAKSQCSNLQRSLARSESPMQVAEWDDQLDRALAERDLYLQEAMALKTENTQLLEQLESLHSEDFVSEYEQLAEKHGELIERLAAFEQEGASTRTEMTHQSIVRLQDENKILQEALANEGDRHAQEVRKLKADLLQFESEAKLQKIKLQQDSAEKVTELKNLRTKLEQKESEMEARCNELSEQSQTTIDALQKRVQDLEKQTRELERTKMKGDHQRRKSLEQSQDNEAARTRLLERIRELEAELSNRPVAALQRLAEMSEQHTRDQRALLDKLDAAASENKNIKQQSQTLSNSLNELKGLHARTLKKYDRLLLEKEKLQHELSERQDQRKEEENEENSPPKCASPRVEQPDENLINALSELQKDVRDMQQQLRDAAQQQSLEQTFLERFRTDLSTIQASLNDAVVELTLETDALLESREAIKTVASDASSLMGDRDESSKARFLDQQQKLLSEFNELRDNLNAAASKRSMESQTCLKELVDDICRKEAALSASQTELLFIKEKLRAEIASRQKLESEIEAYADQADAYEEQLMSLQSSNTSLVKQLHFAGLKIDASLNTMPQCDDEVNSAFATPRCFSKPASKRDESLPVLDEALALAENMANLVRDGEKDGNFLDMLEAMSNLIEAKQTIGISAPVSPKRSSTPRGRRSSHSFDETISDRTLSTAPSSPVSPLKRHRKVYDEATGSVEIVHEGSADEYDDPRSPRQEKASRLVLVVEQLYARCQMLERERSEMMETTLDLLEATKEANSAEIDAVLAGARRRAVEDILEMHRTSKKDQERVLKRIMMNQSKNV